MQGKARKHVLLSVSLLLLLQG